MTDQPSAPSDGNVIWHALTPQAALERQGVTVEHGLTQAEADARRAKYGPNKFAEPPKEPRWQAFLRQYRDPMQIVLLAAGVLSLFLPGQVATGVVLIGLTLLNAAMGLNQEGKANASVAALQKMMVVSAKVRRDGSLVQLAMEQLVPGDIVNIEAGDLVPADGRVLTSATLEIDESALTGESVPVPKQVDPVAEGAGLGDRVDLAFMNTQVTRGAGTILVTNTGMTTEVGQLNALTNQILVIAGVALLISIGIGLWRNTPVDELFLTAIAFAVSAIPTGLPAVVTAILSRGTTTLASAGAIVKRLRSVETLGSTSAINSDKTGTLTLNQMTAVQMAVVHGRYAISGEGYSTEGQITHVGGQVEGPLDSLMLPMALCADAEIRDGALVGDPTEGALVVLAAKGGVDPTLTRERYPRVATLPFDAAYKFMATFHRMTDDKGKEVIRAYVKGAPDQLLARASSAQGTDGQTYPIDEVREPYLTENDRLGAQGLRVLATAQRDFDPKTFDPNINLLPLIADLRLLALVGIVDPPRIEARDAITKAHSAGIQVRMITGDHAITAGAIASQLGIKGRAITGAEFAAFSDEEADRQIDDIGVIARVAPEDKVRLVEILRRKGHIVAMTGDGVNDAPALKAADIGVAMGITGTEVSKEAAVMILTDDNFATIVGAVEQGRALYDNLMRYIRFQMASLFGFISTFLGASIFNVLGGVPFLPLQTLWINFTVTVFQAVGLGYSKPRSGLMNDKPRPKDAQILPRPLFIWLAFVGLIFAVVTLPLIVWAGDAYDEVVAHTMGLVTFSLFHVLFSLETADEDRTIFSSQLIENPTLLKASAVSLLSVFLATTFGPLQRILDTTELTLQQWAISIALASLILIVAEARKLLRRRASASAPAAPAAPAPAAT